MIVTLSGITGVGKSYFKNLIIEKLGFKNLVIVTTREKRDSEIQGRDKYFVTPQQFSLLKEKGEILMDFSFLGNKYAYRKKDLFSNQNSVTELHYNTIYNFRKINNNLLAIYIIPKNINVAKQQLKKRNLSIETENLRIKEIEEQWEEFSNNKELQKQFDYIVYNDYTEETEKQILEIVKKNTKTNCYV